MYSPLNAAQSLWNFGAGSMPDGRGWNTPNTLDESNYNWDWSDQNHSPCWAYDGHNSFCKPVQQNQEQQPFLLLAARVAFLLLVTSSRPVF